MTAKLCLLCCQNFQPEVAAAVAAEGWTDVTVAAFPARCGHPPLNWAELRPLLAACTQAIILGRACLEGLGEPPAEWPPMQQLHLRDCFDLVAGNTLVAEATARGAYLITSGRLGDWRGAARYIPASARELLLLDTGVGADSAPKLAEFAQAAGLPATRLAVGLDHLRQLLGRLVAEWHLRNEQQQAQTRERNHAQDLADHKSAMDFLGRLPSLKNEQETIAAIEEMFYMLFAPQEFHYVRFEEDTPHYGEALPPDLSRQVQALRSDWAWTDTQTGFLLRIARAGNTLGVLAVDRFAFPQYRDRYLNLALSVAGVAGLAIDNARTYQRIKDTEEALRKSEKSLRIAQAMAHLGHWELDVDTRDIRWSDETYRILGYEPGETAPSYAAFLQRIHPEDRTRVEQHINTAHGGGGFNIEFKVVLPDGQARILHGIGEVMMLGARGQAQIVGTLRDVTTQERPELLGVMQDITDQKQLQWKLEREARTDALTGCTNRRHFLELAEHELVRARRYAEDVSVLMLDLDHFKKINDQHGHPVGDLTLKKLVKVCQATLRAEDAIGRLGGEEFAILLPESGRERALEAAERLRLAVAAAEISLAGKPPLRFTASIGVATLSPEDSSINDVLSRADQALYEAKSAGRNRVATK